VTHNGHTRLAALDDLATCGDLAQRTRVSWRATVTRPIALDASTRSNRLRHPRSLAYVRKSKTRRTTARRLRNARRPHDVRRLRGARRSTPRLTRPRRLRSAPSSFNVYALTLKAITLDATMR
jgi:hypothetical protein